MKQQSQVDWQAIRKRGELFPPEALEFVRDALAHTVEMMERRVADAMDEPSRHVSGRELCEGLRELALERYGMLARTVLRKWGIVRTEDFGTIVYTLIDRGELRSSEDDSLDDFRGVYSFDEAFPE